jgi:hypothetical protein
MAKTIDHNSIAVIKMTAMNAVIAQRRCKIFFFSSLLITSTASLLIKFEFNQIISHFIRRSWQNYVQIFINDIRERPICRFTSWKIKEIHGIYKGYCLWFCIQINRSSAFFSDKIKLLHIWFVNLEVMIWLKKTRCCRYWWRPWDWPRYYGSAA